jgi:hypothetical protein
MAPLVFEILIALIGGDDYYGADGGNLTYGLQNVRRPENICSVGTDRVIVRAAYNRLSSHVNHNFWPVFSDDTPQMLKIEDVSLNGLHPILNCGEFE